MLHEQIPLNNVGTDPINHWKPANLERISQRFEGQTPEDLLRWGMVTFGKDIAMATGFGATGIVMMHMLSQIRPSATVFYLQTDVLFRETMDLRDELSNRLGIEFTEVHSGLSLGEQNHQFGRELWNTSPDLCCRMRKVEPLRKYLATKRAWITGIRRDQSSTRANTQLVSWDAANNLVKFAPLASWTREQVWDYIRKHNLPYNKLHDHGYPSIGCWPCTVPVDGDVSDERAGRWAQNEKTECGIHIQPDGRIIRVTQIANPN